MNQSRSRSRLEAAEPSQAAEASNPKSDYPVAIYTYKA